MSNQNQQTGSGGGSAIPQRERHQKSPERKEKSLSARILEGAVAKLPLADKNLKYTEKLTELKGSESPLKQREALHYLQTQLTGILVKLKGKNEKTDLTKIRLENLAKLASVYGITLTLGEKTSLDTAQRLLGEGGATTRKIKNEWHGITKSATDATESFGNKLKGYGKGYLKHLRKKPLQTLAYTMAGAAGIYLGFKLIKWMVGRSISNAKLKAKSTISEIFSPTNILVGLALGGVGLFYGRHKLMALLYEKWGIKLGGKKFDKIAEQLKKGIVPKELEDMAKQIKEGKLLDAAKVKAIFGDKPIPPKIKQALKDDGYVSLHELKQAKTDMVTKAKEKVQQLKENIENKREKYISYRNFIKAINPDLNVKPLLFAKIADQPYENFLQKYEEGSDDLVSLAAKIYQKYDKKKIGKGDLDALLSWGVGDLPVFFTTMLKNKGKFSEFEGKTVEQVMDMLIADPKKYINEKAVEQANKDNPHAKKLKSLLFQLATGDREELLKDEKFLTDFTESSARLGITWVIDKGKDAGVWMLKNGIPILWVESKVAYNVVDRIADTAWGSDSTAMQALGGYLKVGAFGAAVGAPLGSVAGIATNLKHGLTVAALKGGLGGGIKGAVKGAVIWPKYAIKGIFGGIDLYTGKLKPIRSLQSAYNRRVLGVLEDLSVTPRVSKWFNIQSLASKVEAGTVAIDKGLMAKLQDFQIVMRKGKDEMRHLAGVKAGKVDYYTSYAKRYQDVEEKVDVLFKKLGWDLGKGDWIKLTKESDIFKGMQGIDVTDELLDLCRHNRQLLLILDDDTHKLTQLLVMSRADEAKHLARILSQDKGLLKRILENPSVLEHPKVIEAFDEGLAGFKKAVESVDIPARPGVLSRIKNGILRLTGRDADKMLDSATSELDEVEKGVTRASQKVKNATTPAQAAKAKKELTLFQKARKSLRKLISKLKGAKPVKFTKAKDGAGFARAPFKAVDNSAAITRLKSRLGVVEKGLSKASKHAGTASTATDAAKVGKLQKAKKYLLGLIEGLRRPKSAAKLAQAEGGFIEIPVREVTDATEAVEAVGKTSKVAKALKVLGIIGSAVGVGVSIYKVGTSAYEAFTTDIEGRAGIEGTNAAMWAFNGTADAAGLAVLLGSKSVVAGVASKAAVPLIPLMYAGETVYETVKEGNLQSAEWAQKHQYDDLIHQWFGTLRSVSLGDAWLSVNFESRIEKGIATKKKTMHKIYKTLVAIQSNPALLQTLYSDELSGADKTKKLESEIDKSYTKYHEYYFKNEGAGLIGNYDSAKTFIASACMFNQIMTTRDGLKKEGETEFAIGKFNLMEDKFDITGTNKNPKAKRPFSASQIVKMYKKQMIESIKPDIRGNLEKMETSYLLMLYVQMGILIGQKKAAPNEIKLMESHTQLIRMYLQSARNVNMTIATQNPEFFKKQMSFAEISKHLESLSAKGMGKYKEFEKANVEKSPGVYAMYKLAQYFGYSGNQKEEDLKQFFSEEKANFHGVYWDGDEWCVQLANYEFDHGTNESKLTYSSVEKIIKKLYICANYVLEHRQDTIFVNAYEYTYQVEGMAILLQASYNEGVNKYNTKGKKISHIAANPTSFKTKKFEEGGDITKEYSKEIERLGNSAGWSKLDHKVIDKNTIEVKRTDTSEKTVIKKSGDKWNLEKNYATSLTFEQAITLSNVLNFTKKIVKEGKWEGGADRPFQVDGMDIDFDRAGWFKIDTTLIDGDRKGNWMQFMNKIGITHKKLVDVLNGWYVGEYSRVAN